MSNTLRTGIVVAVIVAIIVGIAAYYMRTTAGIRAGVSVEQEKAAAEAAQQEHDALTNQAAAKAAKASNPFQTNTNPLGKVADPLQKTKEVLNPFQ